MNSGEPSVLPSVIVISAVAAVVCAGLIVALRPLLARYALARPNARSSHVTPTPQGGGIAVVLATLVSVLVATIFVPAFDIRTLGPVLAAAILLAVVGAIDDFTTTPPLPRLIMQFVAVAAVVGLLPGESRVVPAIPMILERALLVLAGVWAVNLTNFMDGIDWMTVAEVVPLTGGVVILSMTGAVSSSGFILALALLGAIIGFAPFNRPVARLFLGDVGSLPIGLLLFWLMLDLAAGGSVAAALLLPLYYLGDATITLLERAARGENIIEAHRTHFYQRATAHGWSVRDVVARVFAVNLVLVALALVSAATKSVLLQLAALAVGVAAVGLLLAWMRRSKA
jgi:UDP-N-acetylmuramyl pentapeptide phosphotransferase/UDP-N-acetylglucosamine-1-phosphate transferase